MKIELKNICKSFDKKSNTINNLNLTIEDGEFVALLGPSGCGKSTTMLMIAGIYKPNSGEIYFDNQPVNDLEPKDRNIGMVFQSYALYPHMTVLDNIAFPLKQQRVAKEERMERAKQAAEMVQLGHLLDRKPSELSGGQQQRVALARAIVKKPAVLLLDEPLSNLDARLKIEMREEISRIQKELGITTIMVTHDQEEAMTMADRIAVMKEGQLIQYSTPMDLYSQPKNYFVAQFIGTPPMNFLEGRLSKSMGKYQLQLNDTTIEWDGEFLHESDRNTLDVSVGIRPHDLKLGHHGDIRIEGVVSLVEPIGHSQLVNVKVGSTQVRFFSEPNSKMKRGSKVQLSAAIESIHLFDRVTGESLRKERFQGQDLELARRS
ncbi:sugar ABC transporter ATP-binding protein [Collibacillus ludicampi]|uniref:Sugar ABC transporter ATP-binding protein n=1 Tax=Collibacillus ludicampi TaxID=2771369 RepID=A0AAV4LCC4_9BACL|nr:ABC transporter ATP-binding protein [Collibacillus ludicampi]GIM45371.1 sugar ABC transporter ATP-binding protein [Collibacillus ludicampi]